MTKKEMENAISFIVEQQAQFAVHQQQFVENQEKAEKRIARLERTMAAVMGMIRRLSEEQQGIG
jgi:hypothetical protein